MFPWKMLPCGEEGHRAFECCQWKGRSDIKFKGYAKVTHIDEDTISSHSKDAERGEVLVNIRVMLSSENEPD